MTKEEWHIRIPPEKERLEISRTCDWLRFSYKAGRQMCFHYRNDAEDCTYEKCPIRMTDKQVKEYEEDMKYKVKCKHYDGGGYCKTDNPPPAVIPVKCGGDANKCSLDPPIILRIWNLIYWRRR